MIIKRSAVLSDKIIHPVATALIFIVFAATCASALFRSMHWTLIHDASIMHYIAWEILSGDVPYKDIFDMNMPGTYLLHMFVIRVIGSGFRAWRFFDISWIGFSALSLFLFCLPRGKWVGALAALLFTAFHVSNGPLAVGQRDFFICPLLILAGYLLARCLEKNNQLWYLFFTGVLVGCAITIKPVVVILGILFAVVYILNVHSLKNAGIGSGVLISGIVVAPAIALVWLISKGALPAFWQILTEYLPLYSGLEKKSFLSLIERLTFGFRKAYYPLLLLLFFIGSQSLRNVRYGIVFTGIIYGLIHFFIQGKGFMYHYYPFYCFLITFAAMMIGDLSKREQKHCKAAAVISLALISLPIGFQCSEMSYFYMPEKPLVTQLAKDIADYSLSNRDMIQVLDTTNGGIEALYKLKIRQPTRFVYDFHFYHDMNNPYIIKLRSEFVKELQRNQPKLIVMFHSSWLPPYNSNRIKSFPELMSLLDNTYTPDRIQNGYTIYVKK